MNSRAPLWYSLAFALLLTGSLARADENAPRVWEVARARHPVPGAPRYSDVTVRNLHPHPALGKKPDPYDTLEMIRAFHITRLEWTYNLDAPFVAKLKALGLTVGGAIEDDSGSRARLGRVIGQDGSFVTHKWFPKDRLVGCANAPEFRAAWLEEAKRNIDAGVDLMQQDDPQMGTRTDPPFCYCKYCQEAFAAYQKEHGPGADYAQFQRDSVLAFHLEMHRQLDAYAGRHIPFSHNSAIGFRGKLDWTAPAFDFVNAEIQGQAAEPAAFYAAVAAAGSTPGVFSYRDTAVADNRRLLALTYATGTWMMMPWDVYMPNGAPRYFGKPEDFADLSGFVRANARYLDGYESAAAAGAGIHETRYGAISPLTLEGGSGQAYAFIRARPGEPKAPVVIHLIDAATDPQPFTLRLRTAIFGGPPRAARLRVPVAYEAALHAKAQASGDFSALAQESPVELSTDAGTITLHIPVLHPWGILVLSAAE